MQNSHAVYGVIPARAGSTGIRKKNLRKLGGVPLITHIIKSALQSKHLDKLFVSTEDDEIANLAMDLGTQVIRHDPALSGNSSPSFFVIQNATKHFFHQGEDPEIVVTMRATSPLCPTEYIDKAINLLISDTKADSAVSVVRAQVHPYKVLRINTQGYLSYFDSNSSESAYPMRRQTFDDVYVRNAAIYATRSKVILEGSLWGERIIPVIMPKEASVNINEEIDFILAEALLGMKYHSHQDK